MRSIERRFNNTIKTNPLLSSYICFLRTIWGQKFTKSIIRKWFNKLVDEDDYSKADKKDLFKHLEYLANMPEETQKQE